MWGPSSLSRSISMPITVFVHTKSPEWCGFASAPFPSLCWLRTASARLLAAELVGPKELNAKETGWEGQAIPGAQLLFQINPSMHPTKFFSSSFWSSQKIQFFGAAILFLLMFTVADAKIRQCPQPPATTCSRGPWPRSSCCGPDAKALGPFSSFPPRPCR